ncbi:MAG: folate family ECF transporter S component [Oscillospiraceae bacterium]|nr:folate family ECF transporter S component [Oscillospiraceae bacterium]
MKNANSSVVRGAFGMRFSVLTLVLMGLLAAMSIVLGKLLAINIGSAIRISFENLPILLAGILLGAPAGFLTGIVADIVGCLIVGYAINPVITLGAGCIGLIAGLLFHKLPETAKLPVRVFGSVMPAHVIGSMLIKSAGLMLYYHYTIEGVLPRVPLYIAIGTAESAIILLLLSNSLFAAQIERLKNK